jgi:DNA-directed RNA polymerase specialized sigma24 family protein
MKTYDVYVEPDGRYWIIQIPELNSATQARRFSEIDMMAKDLIYCDIETKDFDINKHFEFSEEVQGYLTAAQRHRNEARMAKAEAAQESRKAVRKLHESGISLRDIGKMLGISFQRVHQLLNS